MDVDNLPLAVRRTRRSNFGVRVVAPFEAQPDVKMPRKQHATLKTPRKTSTSRRPRFSDPGAASTGLTPFLRRSSINAFSRDRCVSVPLALAQQSGADSCIRNVRDGRIERRERRGATRDAVEKIENRHRHAASRAKSEITHLQTQLHNRDREIYELKNATVVVDTDRIWELEGQISSLKEDLKNAQKQQPYHESCGASPAPTEQTDFGGQGAFERTCFDDTTGIIVSTPSRRAQESFPSPPATSPITPIPETPSYSCYHRHSIIPQTPTSANAHVGVQASLIDPVELQARTLELESLRREMSRLTGTLDEYRGIMDRIRQSLPAPPHEMVAGSEGSMTADLERQVEDLLQTLADKTNALENMESGIAVLGFPGNDACEILQSVSLSFRQARLELEYLSPGECSLPLSHHGAEVLDMVLSQLRHLSRKVQEKEDTIDEYHAQEQSLRQQLGDRVLFTAELRSDLNKARSEIAEKDTRIRELGIGNDRLKGAVNGYLRDISELERLVERMEADAPNAPSAQVVATNGTESPSQTLVQDLENRIAEAARSSSDLRDELEVVKSSRKKQLTEANKRSAQALALRDARVGELRGEIDRINSALSKAHWEIYRLRADNERFQGENEALKAVVDDIKTQLQEARTAGEELASSEDIQPRRLLSGKLARRVSGRGNGRRPDSGVGFIDEEDEC